jgi:amino acid transporter
VSRAPKIAPFATRLTFPSFYEALLIPFEISAFAVVLGFWSAETQNPGPLAGIIIGVICCYAFINILAVGAFGEVRFA